MHVMINLTMRYSTLIIDYCIPLMGNIFVLEIDIIGTIAVNSFSDIAIETN